MVYELPSGHPHLATHGPWSRPLTCIAVTSRCGGDHTVLGGGAGRTDTHGIPVPERALTDKPTGETRRREAASRGSNPTTDEFAS